MAGTVAGPDGRATHDLAPHDSLGGLLTEVRGGPRVGRLLCLLGLHVWRYQTVQEAAGTRTYEECRRCGKQRRIGQRRLPPGSVSG